MRPHEVVKASTIQKEITMHANGHATVWGTHIGIGRARDVKGWYHLLRDRWAAYTTARHEAKLAALKARWNARRAVDLVASTHAFSTTTALCDLAL
jgi:hypothetical protein